MESLPPIQRSIVRLREEVSRHEYYYFLLKQPIITDLDYDVLKGRLAQLEGENPQFRCTASPIYRYQTLNTPLYKTVDHVKRMLEYERGSDRDAIRQFTQRVDYGKLSERVHYIFEPIVDGVDVELVYQNAVFERAVLRVDGKQGIDVTQNVKALKGFRLRLYEGARPCPELLSIHAKFFITTEELNDVNFIQVREGARVFLGIEAYVKSLLLTSDFWELTTSPLNYLCIDILAGDEDMVDLTEIREALAQWRLPINPIISDVHESADTGIHYRDRLLEEYAKLPYDHLGVAIKTHEACIREELGVSRTIIRWALELVYPSMKKSARITEINFGIDRRGVLLATAKTKPVYLGGMNIHTARFEHAQDIEKDDIRVGDVVWLERDGERLPLVRGRLPNSDRIGPRVPTRVPTHCPVCQTQLEYRRGILRCVNTYACSAQMHLRLLHFISEDGFNIRHLGVARCQHLIERELISDFADLFRLKWQDLVGLPYVKEGRARLLVQEIQKSRKIRLRNFLFALGIPEVGHIVSGELERVLHSLDEVKSASYRRLLRLRGVGPHVARSIYFYFREPENLSLISKLLDNGVVPYASDMVGHRKKMFNGKIIILAGSLRKYSRAELEALIEAEGGKVITEVVKGADLLIHGRGAEAKVQLARTYRVPAWGEEQLLRNLLHRGVG